MKIFFLANVLLLSCFTSIAQSADSTWNHKKCAVVLTYDDAIPQHLDNAIPLLDSLHLKATFYITVNGAKDRIGDWKKAAANGHELGNHTLYHPCMGGKGREWVNRNYDLNYYTVQRMVDEIKMTSIFLEALDEKKERTFAYTCGDMKVNDTAFMDLLKNDFVAARGVYPQMDSVMQVNRYNINCYGVNGHTATEMKAWVKKAMDTHTLLVILFHGVGGGNGLNVSLSDHRELLNFLKENEQQIWIAPMIDVAKFIKVKQEQKK